MAGLPRKYAKMGFAKGWRAYKSSKKTTKTTAKTAGSAKMARRRYRKLARRSRRSSSSMGGGSVMKMALGGAVYGIVREPINQLMGKVPIIGTFGDEVALGVVSYIAATKGSGWVRTIGRAGVMIEAYNLSRSMSGNLLSGFLGTSSTASTASSSGISFR